MSDSDSCGGLPCCRPVATSPMHLRMGALLQSWSTKDENVQLYATDETMPYARRIGFGRQSRFAFNQRNTWRCVARATTTLVNNIFRDAT